MAVLTAIIKPFICWKKTVRDLVLSFLGSMLCGLLLEYWEIPYAVKVGISGTCGLFAVKIYEVIESILQRIKENPDEVIDKLKDQHLQPLDNRAAIFLFDNIILIIHTVYRFNNFEAE